MSDQPADSTPVEIMTIENEHGAPTGSGGSRLSYVKPRTDGLTLVGAMNVLLRRLRIVAGVPLSLALLAVLGSFLVPQTYTAATSFVPETRPQNRMPTGIAGLASQLGVPLGTEPTESPQFYADVLRSRQLLERVLLSRYASTGLGAPASDSTTLLRILQVKGRDGADSLARGVKRLTKMISIRVDYQTNIVTLGVDARDPIIAAGVANRLVEFLNEFNTKQRQSQARERRRFTEERVTAADSELRRSEDAVKTFYERNRGWQQAPELVFQEGRLRRQVDVSQEVYLTLKREHEGARIEEVNDTPVITVIDPAKPPPRPSAPKRPLIALVGLVLGGMVGVFWAFAAAYADDMRRDEDAEYREMRTLLRRLPRDMASLIRRRS